MENPPGGAPRPAGANHITRAHGLAAAVGPLEGEQQVIITLLLRGDCRSALDRAPSCFRCARRISSVPTAAVSRPFPDQAIALAVRAPEILFIDTGNANHRPDVALAMVPCDQRPQEHADVK